MKNLILICLSLFCSILFSQKKERRSYKFDTYQLREIKDYLKNDFYTSHLFENSKDTTYVLELKFGKEKKATLFIKDSKPEIIEFDVNFDYTEPNNLNQLNNSKLFTEVNRKKRKRFEDFVEEMRFENDTIDNQIIVHIIQYKNNKKKRVINNHYYFLSNKNKEIKLESNNDLVKYLINKYNLTILEGLKLDRIMHLMDNKLFLDTYFIKKEKIDFLFNFEIDEVNPKLYNISF